MVEQIQVCDWCGASWHLHWKCQIICPNCGAKQDCSDLFVDYDEIQRRQEARGLDRFKPVQPGRMERDITSE